MNFSVFGVTLFLAGIVLMYAAIKNQDPRDVLLTSLGRTAKHGTLSDPIGGKAGKFAPLPDGSGELGPKPPASPPGYVWVTV